MPVPRPLMVINWRSTTFDLREHAVKLQKQSEQAAKDNNTLRKKFLSNATVQYGMKLLLFKEPDQEPEAEMAAILGFALDPSSAKSVEEVQNAFFIKMRAPVRQLP